MVGSSVCSDTLISPGGGLEFVSLIDCCRELLVACLSTRSVFIREQQDVLADCAGNDGVVKVPADMAKSWIMGLCSTPEQLAGLDEASLIQYGKARNTTPYSLYLDSDAAVLLCSFLQLLRLSCLLIRRRARAQRCNGRTVRGTHSEALIEFNYAGCRVLPG